MKRKLWLAAIMMLALVCICAAAYAETDRVPSITANGESETLTIPTFTEVLLRINAQGADGVRIFYGDVENDGNEELSKYPEWENEWGDHSNIEYSFHYDRSNQEGNRYGLRVEATYDGGEHWVSSNTVTVTCTAEHGKMPGPSVSEPPPAFEVEVGDEVVFRNVYPGDATTDAFCFADVTGIDEEGNADWNQYQFGKDVDENNEIHIPTGYGEEQLPVGEFKAFVRCGAPGWDIGETGPYHISVIPALILEEDESYGNRVREADDGTIYVPLHQWMTFNVYAPGADHMKFYVLDSETAVIPEGSEALDDIWFNGDDRVWFGWTPNSLPDEDNPADFTKHLYAEVICDEGNTTYLLHKEIDVSVVTTPAMADITFEYQDVYALDENGEPVKDENDQPIRLNETDQSGAVQAARDGRLFVDVDTQEDVDFYGLYIGTSINDDTWIADSHWVEATPGKTRVPLTVARCKAGEDYDVHVFAIQFGYPTKAAGSTIALHVKDEEPGSRCPLIVSMGDQFTTGEPLRIFLHYTNPDSIDGWMNVRIHRTGHEEDEVYNETQGFVDFYDDGFAIWDAGEYEMEADIWTYDPQKEENVIYAHYPNDEYPVLKQFTVNATGGEISIIDPVLPSYIRKGQDLTFTVQKPTNADQYNIEAWCFDPEAEEDYLLAEAFDITEDSIEITIPDSILPEANPMNPKAVSISVMGFGYNKQGDWKMWHIPVIPDSDSRVVLSVPAWEGQANQPTVLLNENVEFRVETGEDENREIKTVCMFDGREYKEHEPPNDGKQAYNRPLSFDEEKTYGVFALVTFDEWNGDPDTREWIATNVIEVTTTKTGDTGPFSFTVKDYDDDPNGLTVTRGEDITVTYTAAAHADHYWIDIEQYNEEGGHWEWIAHEADLFPDTPKETGDAGTATLPTVGLEAGKRYRIIAGADGIGYLRSTGFYGDTNEPLELNIEENDEVTWTIIGLDEDGKMWTNVPVVLGVYVPGAEGVELKVFNRNNDQIWRDDTDRDFIISNWGVDCEDTLTFLAAAGDTDYWYCDENDDPIQIEVRSEGVLPAPEVTAGSGIVTKGEEITFSFAENEALFGEDGKKLEKYQGVWYNTYLWDRDGRMLDGKDHADPNVTYGFSTADLEEGVYRLSVDIQQERYAGAATDQWIIVTAEGIDTGNEHGITLKVETEPDDDGAYSIEPNVEIPVTFSAPGAKAVQFYNGNGWEDEWTDMPNTFTRSCRFDSGERIILARGRWKTQEETTEPAWTYSAPIPLHVYGDRLPDPTVTVTNEGKTADRNGTLSVTVTEGNMEGIEPYRQYYLHIRKKAAEGEEDREYINSSFRSHEMKNGTITLTFEDIRGLPPGEYEAWADGFAEGYDWGSGWDEFTVTGDEPTEDMFTFTATPETTETGNSVMLTAYAKGANRIEIYEVNWDGERLWDKTDGDFFAKSYSDNNPNLHELYAKAWFDEAEWRISNSISVEFTAKDNQRLEVPQVTLNNILHENESFELSMTEVENATEYNLSIQDESIRENENFIYQYNSRRPISVTIPADRFETGKEYRVGVGVSGPGYEGNYQQFTVVKVPNTASFTLKVDGDTAPVSIPVRKDISVYAKAPESMQAGKTAIGVLRPNDSWDMRPGNVFEADWSFDHPINQGVMIAKYGAYEWPEETQADDYDWDTFNWDEFDWGKVVWSGYSNAVQIDVTSEGELPEFKYKIDQTSVTRGEYITVTITNVQDVIAGIKAQMANPEDFDPYALNFSASIGAEGGRNLLPDWYNWDGIDTICIPTAETEDCDEQMYLYLNVNYGEGWMGWGTQEAITVSEPEEDTAYFTTSKTAVDTSEEFIVSLHVPGASDVAVFEVWEDNGETMEDMREWAGADTLVIKLNYGESGEHTLRAKAFNPEAGTDGDWEDVTGLTDITVTVTATEATAIDGFLNMPGKIQGGNEFVFSWSSDPVADHADVRIECVTDDYTSVWHSWHRGAEEMVTVPAFMPRHEWDSNFDECSISEGDALFENGKVYCLKLYLSKRGYDGRYMERFFIADNTETFSTLILPSELTEIEESAFEGASANRIEIGRNVTTIGHRAFADMARDANGRQSIVYADFANSQDIDIAGGAFEDTQVIILCHPGSAAYLYALDYQKPYILKK